MRTHIRLLTTFLLMAASGPLASAQVERVAARANRALWGSCGATIKAVLERQSGVAEVVVDQQKNIVFVTYKPNTRFDAKILREAAEKADAAFVLLQIVARGHVMDEGTKHFLIAGEDRFLLMEPAADKPPLPAASDAILTVVASVDDSADPIRIRVVQANPAE